jgi:hypothetical protein
MTNSRNADWNTEPDGAIKTWEMVQVDVLMDIREQLKRVVTLLLMLDRRLVSIRGNTSKRKRPKRKAVK